MVSKSQLKACKKYEQANQTRVSLIMKNDLYNAFCDYLKAEDKTKNGAIIELIKQELKSKGYLKD